MQKIVFIFLSVILFQNHSLAKNFADKKSIQKAQFDTTLKINDEDAAIDDILRSGEIPKKEKIEYLSQETKYGFKNLFKNYSYSSSMPYSSQVNPYAESYMQDYLQAHGSYLKKLKGTGLPYFNFIDNIFSQYGLPKELKYLAVIESDLKSDATSWVGARGPWQFMNYTAKDYGLQVNGFIDERTDYYKSTHAAARYLLNLYKDLKDWLLVIAAYNGGLARVYSAIKKSGSRNFWALQYYLPEESRNHVKKFIATHYIMEAGEDGNLAGAFNSTDINTNKNNSVINPAISDADAANTETLNISGKYNSAIVARNILMDINEFNRLNPGFDATISSGEDYILRLPSEKMDLFVRNKYPILNECIQALLNDVNSETKTVYPGHSAVKQKNKK